MKNFVLILWSNTRESSVISEEDIRIGRDKVIKAKWGENWYEAEIIKKSESKEYLESLTITTSGEVLTPEKRLSVSPNLLLCKRELKVKDKKGNELRKQTTFEENRALLQSASIFQKAATNLIAEKSSSGEDNLEDMDDEPDERASLKGDKQFTTATCFCRKLEPMTEADIEKLNSIIKLIKIVQVPEILKNIQYNNNSGSSASMEKLHTIELTDTVELMPQSKVMVNRHKLEFFKNHYGKNPRELVRRLMKLIIGEEKLRTYSATGKSRPGIPVNIYTAVYEFVNQNAARKKYTLDTKEYREVLTNLCSTIRSTSKSSAKSTVNQSTKNLTIKSIKKSIAPIDEFSTTDDEIDVHNLKNRKFLWQENKENEEEHINSKGNKDKKRADEKMILQREKVEDKRRKLCYTEKMKAKIEEEYRNKLQELQKQLTTAEADDESEADTIVLKRKKFTQEKEY